MELIEVDMIELCILRRYRDLREQGWGELHVQMENQRAVNLWLKLTNDPKELREIQQQNMNTVPSPTRRAVVLSSATDSKGKL